ncbi:MAG: hypothetical protein PHS92_00130 [Candidatus Gracilibacteria bacterium]|nr:hypothetical protein [Candidatus Gracilibacteria bacterium]
MKKIFSFIIILSAFFSIKIAFGYSDYDSCSTYYSHKNDSFCYNKYKSDSNSRYSNSNYYYDRSYDNSYYPYVNNGYDRTVNDAYDDYDSCRSYYNYGNDSFCNNYFHGSSYQKSNSYYDYNSCRKFYNYSNDAFCISRFNNVIYTNSDRSNNSFYDYDSCRRYYNYNNDALCNSYYYGIANTYYTDYSSCSKYYKYNNDSFCSNRYNGNYNSYGQTRTGEENYWNLIYMNGLEDRYSNSSKSDFFTRNVIGTSVEMDKFDSAQMINFGLTNSVNKTKYSDATRFVNALRSEISTRYQNGTITYDKMNDIINDFSYYIYYTNLYFENLRNIEKGKNISMNQKSSIENLTKVKTFFNKLKFTLSKI